MDSLRDTRTHVGKQSQRGHILLVDTRLFVTSIVDVEGMEPLVSPPKTTYYLMSALSTIHPDDISMIATIVMGFWMLGHQRVAYYRRNWGYGWMWVRGELDSNVGGMMELAVEEAAAKKFHERDVKATTLYRLLTPRGGIYDLSSFSYTKKELKVVVSVLEGKVVLENLRSFVRAGNITEPDWGKNINTFKIAYSNIGDDGVSLLSDFLSKNTSLQHVDLSFVNLSPKSLNILSSCNKIRSEGNLCPIASWYLNGNNCSENLDIFASSLQGGTVYAFGLSAVSISTAEIVSFLKALPLDAKISTLNISSNNLSNYDGTGLDNRELMELGASGLYSNILGLVTTVLKGKWNGLKKLNLNHNMLDTSILNTLLPKLLQTPLRSLSISSNPIGDAGCQLVAASLSSLGTLTHLDVSFCQISGTGISTLSRSALGVETLESLSLAGNSIRVQAAICLSYALAHHPRLSRLTVDNCSLCKVAQCYLVAGIASNRWVPMKHLTGFKVGPPMAEIGIIQEAQQTFINEVCFKIQRDNMLNEIILNNDNPTGVYVRMMRYMTKIPFDDDELMSLRKFFYDEPVIGWTGEEENNIEKALENYMKNQKLDKLWGGPPPVEGKKEEKQGVVGLDLTNPPKSEPDIGSPFGMMRKYQGLEKDGHDEQLGGSTKKRRKAQFDDKFGLDEEGKDEDSERERVGWNEDRKEGGEGGGGKEGKKEEREEANIAEKKRKKGRIRIRLFPEIRKKLEKERRIAKLKFMSDSVTEDEKDAIAQAYANTCLFSLRQLRYHCMSSKLDGWRHTKNDRKLLIVDDSIVTRKLLKKAFEKANCIVDLAENGDVAVDKMKTSLYDTVFMDLDMPVLDGIEATRQLRKWEDVHRKGARQPICALTSAVLDDVERRKLIELKEAGLDVFETKPVNVPRLMKVVDDVSDMFSDLRMSTEQRIVRSEEG
mmetsp:Transcript_5466/g.10941  ORF Transcript_5466/g.10941 Transcript_5466/m.10941 type:complete len:941 (+) Transcript_5466:226-3048(+)